MSSNIDQIYTTNPAASMQSADLLYLGRSPYSTVDDYAITWADMQSSITEVGTIAAGVWQGTTVGIAYGGTGVTSVTTSPTASAFAGWDASQNLHANNFVPGLSSTVTAAGTTVLTVASDYYQYFTGGTTQTVTMPVVTTLSLGQSWMIVNNSSGIVTVQSSGGNSIQAMAANSSLLITCISLTGTGTSSWNATYNVDLGGVTSITGTANQVIASSATGDVTLSLPQSIATSSSPTFLGASLGNVGISGNTITTLDANGNLYINPNGSGRIILDTATEFAPSINVQIASVSSNCDVVAGTFSATQSNASIYYMYKSASTTVGTFAAVADGDFIGYNIARADDGTSFVNAAYILYSVEGAVSTGIVPGMIRFYTSNTSGSATEAMRISNAQIVTLANALPVGSGGLGITSTPSNGQIPIGNGTTYSAATLTEGAGITITNGAGTITIASDAGGLEWSTVAGTTQAAAVDNVYVIGNASQTTVTLPATADLGSTVAVEGLGAGGWILAANTGQTIQLGTSATSSAGSLTSAASTDNVYVACIVANTTWRVQSTNSTGLTIA